MVDRPIKKSDREAAQQNPSADSQSAESKPAPVSNVPPPIKKADRKDGGPKSDSGDQGERYDRDRDDRGRGGKGRGKGRGRGKGDAPKTPTNPALMRGPKPTKKVEAPEEPEVEETAEATEATAEGEATTPEASTETAAAETETTAE
ncbi:MAG: hypothetical protein AAFO84_09370, partial [Cyanobacteria bacterium J06598_1]